MSAARNREIQNLQEIFREALTGHQEALRSTIKRLDHMGVAGKQSLYRIARQLLSSAETFGFPTIIAAASKMIASDEEMLKERAEELLVHVEDVIKDKSREKVQILVVEDERFNALFMKKILEHSNREVLIATSADEAEELLIANNVSLIVLDLILPDRDGRGLLVQWREGPETSGIPIVVTSGETASEVKTECYALGADLYVEKPIDPNSFSALIAAKLARFATTRQSHLDTLTGIPNRAYLRETFRRMASFSIRQKDCLSLGILDLDFFKRVNDTYGHLMGDEVLQRFAHILKDNLRQSDFVARWGGEEFVVLFPGTEPDSAITALENVLTKAAAETFYPDNHDPFHVTFSGGVIKVPSNMSLEDAVASADHYLYLAKASGRNQIKSPAQGGTTSGRHIVMGISNSEISEAVSKHFTDLGYGFHFFCKSSAVLDKARELADSSNGDGVIVFILETQLSGESGFDLLDKLRSIPQYKNSAILMLTGTEVEEDIAHGFEMGANDFISTPFSDMELISKITQYCKSDTE